jgi:hypothetical protein
MSAFVSKPPLQLLRRKYRAACLAYRGSAEAHRKASEDPRTLSPDVLQLEASSLRETWSLRTSTIGLGSVDGH